MSESIRAHRRPATVATLVLLTGVAASLAGNLQAINLDNAAPGVGAHISAVFWPAILFGTVELLIHTPWLASWRDRLTKAAVVLLVAAVAAWVSYWHLANVLSHYGYDVASRYAGPLAIDAAMVLATLALNRVGHARRLAMAITPGLGQALANGWGDGQPGLGQALASTDAVANGQYLATLPVPAQDFVANLDAVATWDGRESAEDVAKRVADGQALASAYATIGDEASDYLARLSNHPELDTASTPPAPLPQRPTTERTRAAKYDRAAARAAIAASLKAGMDTGMGDAAVAEAFGISVRTARRLRAEVTGQPVSGPPDDEAAS